MKRPIKKIGAAVLAGAVFCSVLACGCSKRQDKNALKDESGLILTGKMPDKLPDGLSWYNFKEDTALFDSIKEKIGGYYLCDITWVSDRIWIYVSESEPKTPVYHIMSFDKDGNNLTDNKIANEFGDNISLDRMVLGDGLYLDAYDFASERQYLYPIDEKDGSVSPSNKIDIHTEGTNRFCFIDSDVAILENSQTPSVVVFDKAAGKEKQKVSLETLSRDFHIKYPEGILCAGKTKVIVWGSTSSNFMFGQKRFCLVDLESGKISALDEMEYINIPLRNMTYCNGKLVTVTDGGIYNIDTDAGKCEMILSFNCSVCNRYLLNNSELKYIDDEKILFSYAASTVGEDQDRNIICTLTKTDEYPAAGKNILTVASTEDLDYTISEAIMRFNSENNSSFMLFDNRYKANSVIDYTNTDNTDQAELNSLSAYATITDRLIMDIVAGEGPDILITNGSNEQFSKSDYFIDLSDYLKNESGISESEYFTNAIEASRYNGALYQLPIGFYVDCLMSKSESFGGKNSQSFEDYKKMVKNVCNGQDPVYDHQLSFSRSEVATKLFANASDLFINNGKINVNREEFKTILDYCKDLPTKGYFEGKDVDSEWEDLMRAKESMPVQPVVIYGFYEYEVFAEKYADVTVCGYPSVDGRTATIGSNLAVSVSSHSSDIDSCKKFLNILLSDDIQKTLFSSIPISKKCAKELALAEINQHNDSIAKNASNKYAKSGKALDTAIADRYIDQLSKATTSGFVYHSISLIIYEEIPAYFEGQKSFEEVAETINNRAQTVLNEKK